MVAWRVKQSCPASRRDTLISHPLADREPISELLHLSPRRSPGPALKSDQPNRRPTEKLQIPSWNTGPARGSDLSLLASHFNGRWNKICVHEGSWFVSNISLKENLHVATQFQHAVLPNKECFERDLTCSGDPGPLLSGVLFMGYRRPDQSCSHFTVANIRMNNEGAKRKSVCHCPLVAHPRPVRAARRCHPHR